MRKRRLDKCICALFCAAIGLMLLLFLLLPQRDFSVREKRYLAKAPVLDRYTLFSGDFSRQAEAWAADHLPGRDALVGLKAWSEWLSGRQGAKEIYRGRSGRLYEAPLLADEAVLARKAGALRDAAELLGRPLDLMLVPSAGCVMQEDMPPLTDPYEDAALLSSLYAQTQGALRPLNLLGLFAAEMEPDSLYYRTDHHWSSRGAQLAAAAYLESKGRQARSPADYRVERVDGFLGSTYARSGLWGTRAESIELWDSGGSFTVENADAAGLHEGLFYREHLGESDKYPVFLDGNHSLLRIHNPAGSGKLLMIRDSFASCMGGFLADSYAEVVMLDLRYCREPVSALLEQEDFDEVLILYGLKNFMEESNLERME